MIRRGFSFGFMDVDVFVVKIMIKCRIMIVDKNFIFCNLFGMICILVILRKVRWIRENVDVR